MRNSLKLTAVLALVVASATVPTAARLAGPTTGPAFTAIGPLAFAPDGTLYISHGDSGIVELAQDPASLAGKILRIRVNPDGSYAIPSDNPSPTSAVRERSMMPSSTPATRA